MPLLAVARHGHDPADARRPASPDMEQSARCPRDIPQRGGGLLDFCERGLDDWRVLLRGRSAVRCRVVLRNWSCVYGLLLSVHVRQAARVNVIGLDPGPEKSAIVVWNGIDVQATRLLPNQDILDLLYGWRGGCERGLTKATLVIEKIESFGMAVGAETFETVFWSGRFAEAYGMHNTHRLGRKAIKVHLCGSARATDSNIRYALMDRFGGKDKAIGKKASPGVLFGITSHLWSALAVAITWRDMNLATGNEPSQGLGAAVHQD